jgi:hypothetical protein
MKRRLLIGLGFVFCVGALALAVYNTARDLGVLG